MIAIITSTLYPPDKSIFGEKRSAFSFVERHDQTRKTILSLLNVGYEEIFLLDNSDISYHPKIHDEFNDINVLTFDNYQFNNRSISEAILILNAMKYLPINREILKISGRYCLNNNFIKPAEMNYQVIAKGFSIGSKRKEQISTRCYMVKDKALLEEIMLKALVVIYSSSYQIVGPRSFVKFITKKLQPGGDIEPTYSIEMAVARVIRYNNIKVKFVDKIGVDGFIAGAAIKNYINE